MESIDYDRLMQVERILESGKTRLHLSGELRSSDIEAVRAEIEISPRDVLDLAEIGVVDIGTQGALRRAGNIKGEC